VDTRGIIRELGLTNGGVSCRVSPDGLYLLFFDSLRKCIVSDHSSNDLAEFENLFCGILSAGQSAFTQIRLAGSKATTVEKHIATWMHGMSGLENSDGVENSVDGCGIPTAHDLSGGSDTPTTSPATDAVGGCPKILKSVPKILHVQFLSKIRDRLDVSERINLEPYLVVGDVVEDSAAGTDNSDRSPRGGEKSWKSWIDFLDHECDSSSSESSEVSTTAAASVGAKYST
jgi:hypothetical protein